MDEKVLLCKGIIEKIGYDDSSMTCKHNGNEIKVEEKISCHADGIQLIFDKLTDSSVGILNDIKDINAVGHRVVHGGEKITSSEVINPEIKNIIKECIALAPLHNPHNLEGIEAVEKYYPVFLILQFLILHFIHQCLQKHLYILFLMNSTKNTV